MKQKITSFTFVNQGISAKSSKDGSVKKTLILGIVPRIQELHCNVKKILDILQVEGLEFSHSADIKMRRF